ncbi:girdin-like isoform X2 [Leptopilina boulardi]|uniref:girdin-like isoform X2 n=1 Tax=Leptopilina boulardi TaxID=63433 RepID=UPI0021F60698|nr:girdin-like isoform X2 [Leptopilina boulardi]
MSYIDHGSRIFSGANGLSMSYGDYVLPRKRSEGRLKTHDSCSDIRAWSLNPTENSRYFRELAEDIPNSGKVVPFNVLIDNLIKMGSQTQEELESVKKELENYKSLKLTVKQKEELERFANTFDDGNKVEKEKKTSLLKMIKDTFSSNDDAVSDFASDNIDVSVQVKPLVTQTAVQNDSSVCESGKTTTDFTSSTSKSTLRDEKSFCSVNSEFENESVSESGRSIYETEVNRSIIIEKDSKIIALENEVEAKNVELEEREEKINGMRITVLSMKDVIDQKSFEVEDLKTKLKLNKLEKRRLQESLNNQCVVSDAQLEEINKLRYRVNHEEIIQSNLLRELDQMQKDRDSFKRKIDEMQKEVREKTDILCDNEREYHELFLSWERTSEEYKTSKAKTMEVLKALEYEIDEKNRVISKCEKKILNVEQEIGDIFVMLQTSLSEIEFIDKGEMNLDNCQNDNIILQTKATVSNVHLLIKFLETDRKELQKQLDEVKSEKKNETVCAVCDAGTYVNYESSIEFEETPKESEIEIQNLNDDKCLLNKLANNSENSQDHIESQVTDQESTIEMWNCSFDEKIDSALESHVTYSILKIRKLAETFKNVDMEKLKTIQELKSEIEIKNLEIKKLTKLNNENIRRSEDLYEKEKFNLDEKNKMKEEIHSYKLNLFDLNEEYRTLQLQAQKLHDDKNILLKNYEKAQKEIEFRNEDLVRIQNSKQKIQELQLRLKSLQVKNEILEKDLESQQLEAQQIIEDERIKFENLQNEKERIEHLFEKIEKEIELKDSLIGNLRDENSDLAEKVERFEKNVMVIEEKLKYTSSKTLKELQKKVDILNEEKMQNIIEENKNLTCCIDILKEQFKKIITAEKIENKVTIDIERSNKMMKNVDRFRENYENQILQEKERKIESIVSKDITEENNSPSIDCLSEKTKNHLENENRQREGEIEKLKCQLNEKNVEIQTLEEKHKQMLITVTKKKVEEIKNLKNYHDQKIQKLEDNFNKWNNDGLSFGTENWLESLNIEELKMLCQRIASLLPVEELSKIFSNKQNKSLQEHLSEKQELIDKVMELEKHILKLKNQNKIKVEELELKLDQERCKSARLQKHLSQTYDDGISKEAKFYQSLVEQNYIKNRSLYYQSGRKKILLDRKAFSGDECNDNRSTNFIHLCSKNMRRK